MMARRLVEVVKTFLAVLLWLAGLLLAGAGVVLSVLGSNAPTLWYLFVGAAFITLGILLFRWHPRPQAPVVTLPVEKALD
jgi:glucose dehydrogenase